MRHIVLPTILSLSAILLAVIVTFFLTRSITSPTESTEQNVPQPTPEEPSTISSEMEQVEATPERSPNVLLIILDDIGLDYFPGFLEGMDFEKAPMPVTESLMEDGFRFTNLNTYAMCSPTRASLLTGRHGVDTGVLDAGRTSYLDPKWQSIQKEIESASNGEIASAVFGKWHLLGREGDITHPNLFVDHYEGIPTGNHESYSSWDKVTNGVETQSTTYSTTDFTSAVFGKWHLLGREGDITHPNLFVDHYEGIPTGNHESYSSWDKVTNGVETQSTTYSTTDFTDSAIAWIADQEGQWFTWLAYTAPHTPLHLPPAELHSFDTLSGEQDDLRRNRDAYFKAMLESVDTEIGRLLDSLSEEDRSNTFVIIMGDNGTGSTAQEPFRTVGTKGTMHAGGIHTPLVVFSPYQNGNTQEVDALVSTIDFFPTILDIFSLTPETSLPGKSFYPLISETSETYQPNKFIFSQSLDAVTVRSESHRLIRNTDENTDELFNLLNDPFEEQDVFLLNRQSDTDSRAYEELSTALEDFLQGNY